MFLIKPLHSIDSYKLSHKPAYPIGTELVYSNLTPRSLQHLNVPLQYKENVIAWVGGQATIQDLIDLWDANFFSEDFETVDEFYKTRIAPFAGTDYDTAHIKELHELGYLPLEIRTLPEGTMVPAGVPVLTIVNTDKRFYWLTNYLETHLSAEIWKTPTAATLAYYYNKILKTWAEKTGGSVDFIPFQAHDFSHRGMSGSLDAAKTGVGHLAFSLGTDNIVSVDYIEYHYFYPEDHGKNLIGCSVPATEHSVATAYGKDEREYLRRIVTEVYPKGIVSVVADSYDFFGFLTNHIAGLKEEILARGTDALGMSKVVVRPDSGDPVDIICGKNASYIQLKNADALNDFLVSAESYEDKVFVYDGKSYIVGDIEEFIREYGEDAIANANGYNLKFFLEQSLITEYTSQYSVEEEKGAIEILWEIFGGTTNEKGFRTLNSKIGLIYGDSITLERADQILSRLAAKGFASDNVVFGIGSYTYQYLTRDTLGWAMKATYTVANGNEIELFKDPKTDNGTKKSAKGLLKVLPTDKGYVLVDQVTWEESQYDTSLSVLYKDGEYKKFEDFNEIRNRFKSKTFKAY